MATEVAAGYVSLYARMEGSQVRSEIENVVGAAFQQTGGFIGDMGGAITNVGKAVTVMGGLADVALKKMGTGLIDTISMGESAAITFDTMGKSMGEAAGFTEQFLKRLNDFSVKTPFEFTNTSQAVKQLMAMGYKANEILDENNKGILVSAGNAASALGLTDEGLSNILLQFGHIKSMGKTMSYQMNALARNGLPAWKMLADYMGTSIEDVRAQVRAGAVDADTTIAALMAGMEQYDGQMERMSHTFKGIVSNFNDAMKAPISLMYDDPGWQRFTESLFNLTEPLAGLAEAFVPVLSSLFASLAPVVDNITNKVKELTEWLKNTDPNVLARVFKNAAVAINSGPLLMLLGKGLSGLGGFVSGFGATVTKEMSIANKAIGALSNGLLITKESGVGVKTAFKSIYSEISSGGKYFNDLKFYTESFATKARFSFSYLGRSVKNFASNLKEPGKLTDKLGNELSTLGRRASISAGQFKSWGDAVKAYSKLPGVSERIKEFGGDLKNIGTAILPALSAAGNFTASVFKSFAMHILSVSTGIAAFGAVGTVALGVLTKMGVSISDLVGNGLAKLREMVNQLPGIVQGISNMFANLLSSNQLEVLFSQLTVTLPNILRDVVANIGTLLTDANIGEAFKRVVTIIAATIAENGPIILDGILKAFGAALQGIAAAIPIVVAYIPEFMNGMAQAIVDNGPIILDGFVRMFEGIAAGIGVALGSVRDALRGDIGDEKTFDNLTTAMDNLNKAAEKIDPQPFIDLAKGVGDLGIAIGSIALDVLTGIMDQLGSEAGKKAIEDFASAVGNLAGKLSDFAEDKPGGSGAKKLGDFIGGIAIGTIELASKAIDGLATAIGNLNAALGIFDAISKDDKARTLTETGNGLKNMAEGFEELSFLEMNPLPMWLEGLSAAIRNLGGPDLYGMAKQGLIDFANSLTTTGESASNTAQTVQRDMPPLTDTLNKFGDQGSESTKKLTDELGNLNGAVSDVGFDELTQKASGMADSMEGSFRRAANSTSGFGPQVRTSINTAQQPMGRIVSDAGVMASGVGSNFAAAGSNSQRMVPGVRNSTAQSTSAFNGFVSSVGDGTSQVGSYTSEIPGMFDVVHGIDISGAGVAIMSGFLSGLQSMWGSITSFISGIAAWIAAHKGPIDYDRRLLIPAGKAIMGGLYKGLQDGFKRQVMPFVTSMADSIEDGISSTRIGVPLAPMGASAHTLAYSGALAGATSNRNVVINATFVARTEENPEQFMRRSMRIMEQYARSEGR